MLMNRPNTEYVNTSNLKGQETFNVNTKESKKGNSYGYRTRRGKEENEPNVAWAGAFTLR